MYERRPSQRGFLIITVMVLLVVVVIVTSWMLRSSAIRSSVAQRQVNAYEQHHQLLSVRHIALRWIGRQQGTSNLDELAGDPREGLAPPVVYDATLPDGMSIRMTLERGQGLASRDVEAAKSQSQRALMLGVLARINEMGATDDLTRKVGPIRMVLTSCPDAVLQAIGAGRPALTDALFRLRDEGEASSGAIQTTLQNYGVDVETASAIATELFASDTRLWKLTAYTEVEGNRRAYRLYMMQDAEGGQMLAWKILEARLLELEDDNSDAGPASVPTQGSLVR